MSPAAPLLCLDKVGKTFESPGRAANEALRDIAFTIAEGEFVSIVGASGSGKSTLLRIIDGLIPPSCGTVHVDGIAVKGPGRDRAMVFQQDSLLPWRTVIDNVGYGLMLAGQKRAVAARTATALLAMVGLADFAGHYPHQLSGGMRQRVNIARALAVDPRILLLDEPFAALDAQTREIMQTELLSIWAQSRKTILLITHQIDEAVLLSDRVIVFSARPGMVKTEIAISLPRPRTLEMKRLPAFTALVDRIWKLIESEVRLSLVRT